MYGDDGEGMNRDHTIYSTIDEAERYALHLVRKFQRHDFFDVHIAVITSTVNSAE
jgi:hypothetical protein